MSNTINKILVVVALVAFTFGVVSYFTGSNTLLERAFAWGSSCGSCGDNGSSTGGNGDNDGFGGFVKLPNCTMSASPFSITKGESTTLNWNTNNAVFANIEGVGGVSTGNGSRTVSPSVTTTYKMEVKNSAGNSNYCQAKVTVNEAPVVRTCELSANVRQVTRGGQVTLNWSSSNFDTVTINGESVAKNGNKTYTVNVDTTFKMEAKSADGKSNCIKTVTVLCVDPAPVALPECTLNAGKTTITRGESTKITWTTKNAESVTLNGQSVNKNGNRDVSPTQNTKYVLVVKSKDGKEVKCEVTIKVKDVPTPEPVPAPVCESFTASPTTINKGGSSTLAWTTKNAEHVTIDNAIGKKDANGSVTVSPKSTTTYTLTVHGKEKTVSCQVTVKVNEPTPEPEPEKVPVCESFTASKTRFDHNGGETTLTWKTKDATRVTINGTVVTPNNAGSVTRQVTKTTEFVLKATNDKGKEAVCKVKVLVDAKPTPEPTPITCENNVSFGASPSSIRRGGETTLTWNTTGGVTSAHIDNGIGNVNVNGSRTVSPDSTTTYRLTVSNDKSTVHCPVTVTVTTSGGGGGGYVTPTCELTASERSIKAGQAVRLSWKANNVDSVILRDNHGNTLVDAGRRDRDLHSGSIVVNPTKDTRYTLTIDNGSRTRDCEVEVKVGGLTIIEDRDQQPIVNGITLTEVPHTGFEAGPVLTVLFYLLLGGWAAYLAYFFVARQGLEVATVTAAVAPTVTEAFTASAPTTAVDNYQTPNFHQATPSNLPTVSAAVVGYANVEAIRPAVAGVSEDVVTAIENRAHGAHVLLSSDALRSFVEFTEGKNRMEILDTILANVAAEYPTEDGWVVLNEERMAKQCAACFTPVMPSMTATPIGAGSLAESIATGNVVAAYQMIGNRPMIALADAAADLDAAYRAKAGMEVSISDVLAEATATKDVVALQDAIKALTSALDGTYTTEEEAVKMAIMKAVKALA